VDGSKPNAVTAGAYVVGQITWGSIFRSLIIDFNRKRDGVHDKAVCYSDMH
jgi:hypothetical protein